MNDQDTQNGSRLLGRLRAWGPTMAAGLALATVATVAGIISYGHINALTLALHQSPLTGHLMPFGVDGQIVVGSVVLLTGRGRHAHWGWLGIVPGLAESLFANWESGITHGLLAATWATVPAQAFAVSTFMLERWAKSLFSQSSRGGQPETVSDGDVPDVQDADPCPHSLALTADDAAVQAFLHARDCLGETLSQRELSAAFGISRPKVAELVKPHLAPVRYAALNGNGAAPDPATLNGSHAS